MASNRWVLGARPRTLPAAIVPVAVGTAAAVGQADGGIIWWRAAAALVVSLTLQLATNFVNDYADGQRGTDDDRVGPVRLVASGLATAKEVKTAAGIAFAVAGLAGTALALAVGPELFVVGAASMLAGWAYTGGPRPYAYVGLGEVFVFVFFGLVATVGSAYVQTGQVTALSVVASIPVGLLAVALLVINNLRDIPGDSVANKFTLAVRFGDEKTRQIYVLLFALVGVAIAAAAAWRPLGLIGVVGLVAAVPPIRAVMAGDRGTALIPILGQTGRTQLLTGLLFAVGLSLGG
ncbi:MAG: 1,4-dihydroxy-2-naphthoate octaprenyltransferase [Acidimicrobiales bacterium]|jgi:1,4-dihydroxy-2-naphthoate octaprenyltransferase